MVELLCQDRSHSLDHSLVAALVVKLGKDREFGAETANLDQKISLRCRIEDI